VQAIGSSPLVAAFERGDKTATCQQVHTIADSICVGKPRDHIKALRSVYESNGAMIAIPDEEILKAMRTLAQHAGVFAEPAGATGFAGLCKLTLYGKIGKHERVVCVVTGNGLKDVPAARKALDRTPVSIDPNQSAVESWVERLSLGREIT
jgi:threonine synthase